MNKSKLIVLGTGIGLVGAAMFSFEFHRYTGWTDERVDAFTLRSVCKTTTFVGMFGKMAIHEGPELPAAECREAINVFLLETPNEGCLVNKKAMTATCKEAYEHPFF